MKLAALTVVLALLVPTAARAQDAPVAATLAGLCAALRAEEGDRMSRCRTERTARRGRVHVAVLRLTVLEGNSPAQLVLVARGRSGWRRIGFVAPAAHSGHGMLGTVELMELRVAEDDGHAVVRARARYWQGEPDGDCVRGPVEEHLTLCRQGGEWRCLELPVGSGAERAREGPLSEGGATCTARAGSPEWSVEVALVQGTVTIVPVRGVVPEPLRARLVTRSFEAALD